MDPRDSTGTFRSPNSEDYPELAGYSRDAIYEDCMGGGGLYLAAHMVRQMRLAAGGVVMDLGCGKGATPIFLARHCGVRVVAVDLWVSATLLHEKFTRRGQRDAIVPLNLDITGPLPFAQGYFDAIFCMNSFSFYGGSTEFLHHLLRHLKRGGEFVVGMESLSDEFTPDQVARPPSVYNYRLPTGEDVWEGDFLKMHSPRWWERLFLDSGLLEVYHCAELPDADILYEDLVLYQIEHDLDPHDVGKSIAQILWGRSNRPRKTLFTLAARRL
jgi:SAM-dependent methyltransferase